MLADNIKRAITRGLLTGTGAGLLIALPIAFFFGDLILWSLLSIGLCASVTVNACIAWAILTDKAAHENNCSACAYDLTGLDTDTCPECGHNQSNDPKPYQPPVEPH